MSGVREIWEMSVPSQFCYEPKTAVIVFKDKRLSICQENAERDYWKGFLFICFITKETL
jgi:hypothetical protein